jgi:hypothetical protein
LKHFSFGWFLHEDRSTPHRSPRNPSLIL